MVSKTVKVTIKEQDWLHSRRARIEYGNQVIEEWEQRIDKERALIHVIEQEIAEYLAEFKPGTRVLYAGMPFEITRVRLTYGDNVSYYGKKIKKDGAPGSTERELHAWRSDAIVLDPQQPKE